MNRIILFVMIGIMGYAAEVTVSTPSSADALSGKSVYTPPSASIDVVEEGCVQKEDQNATGHGGAKW
ncbi:MULTISPECIES: hypothetical protein [unclassified Sulfuricurvum]|uniref:hypothetical protein n=1 Tax=unclassified Sulfuricurvum TaxID=2632390 RepID=UPI0002995FBB|nr:MULTISPECIES: hypothetical protein [unclassified Sulfuricurvum]OHD82386.1 MAG: hypothetical protein A3D90_01570 [Sulfuricurvum sp. RIFCSPHIGHO2_02_FULL_43_9]OHD85976.1 MAG: hypothetical protein A3I60_00585 [Sulfuricurvum sp. RIFCSPLOWO2_02_FULL_43_45]OHD86776.1 MAG: hypothetical protein A3J39_05940 [Sulfuricurvum sp. RIFCSPHIGHO2_12_FULL_44_8]OHD87778.1 MAG: hypothetical protein A2Y52_04140 [Sulfuricurvum sp. RIFCSPLOWO2_02_43_6]OHD92586.1 MAG: hypothetical protein A2W83_00145 [Sulfuricurvu